MFCHDLSCFVMGPASAPVVCAGPAVVRHALQLPFRPRSRTPRCRRSVPLPRIMRARVSRRRACAPACAMGGRGDMRRRRRAGTGSGRGDGWGSVAVIGASFGAKGGTGGPCFARIVRGWVRGRGRAYRGGAVRAPDCPHARARDDGPGRGRTPPVRLRRGFLGPQPCFLQKSGKAVPEAAFLSCLFYTIPLKVNLSRNKK